MWVPVLDSLVADMKYLDQEEVERATELIFDAMVQIEMAEDAEGREATSLPASPPQTISRSEVFSPQLQQPPQLSVIEVIDANLYSTNSQSAANAH
jgi:hypothetical protein